MQYYQLVVTVYNSYEWLEIFALSERKSGGKREAKKKQRLFEMHACSCSYTDDDVSHYNNYLIFSTLWIMIIIMHCMHMERKSSTGTSSARQTKFAAYTTDACMQSWQKYSTHTLTHMHTQRTHAVAIGERTSSPCTYNSSSSRQRNVRTCMARRGKEEEELTPYSTYVLRTYVLLYVVQYSVRRWYVLTLTLAIYWPDHRRTHSIHWAGRGR